MSDIVERLRAVSPIFDHAVLCRSAADEIERLRAALRQIGTRSVTNGPGRIVSIREVVNAALSAPPAGDEESEGR